MAVVVESNEISLEETLLQTYSPDRLSDIFRIHFKTLLDLAPQLFTNWNLNRKEYEGLSVRPREIARLISIAFTDREIFSIWRDNLPFMVFKVLETLIWEGQQEIHELNRRAKGKLLGSTTSANSVLDYTKLPPDFCLFVLSQYTAKQTDSDVYYYLSLPLAVKKKLKSHLPKPKGYQLKPLKSPEPTDHEFSDRNLVLSDLQIIFDYIRRGSLKITKSGSPRVSSLSEMARLTELEEFFPGQTDSEAKTLRVFLMVHLLLQMQDVLDYEQDSAETIKVLFLRFADLNENILLCLLSHIKGRYQSSELFDKDILRTISGLVRELPLEKWISLKQLIRFARLRDISLQPRNSFAVQNLYIPKQWHGWGNAKQFITPDKLFSLIGEPLLKAAFFLFAAFGLVDLKYDYPPELIESEKETNPHSIFDGLRYLRLTPLGAFICGLAEQPPDLREERPKTTVILDEDRLIITVFPEDNRVEMALERLSKRIGRNRFKVDFECFLESCSTIAEIERKISDVRQLATHPVPQNWERFFTDIEAGFNSLRFENDFSVVKIVDDQSDLSNLIMRDRELRQMVLLAENQHFLVKKENIPKLRQKLRIFGYLF